MIYYMFHLVNVSIWITVGLCGVHLNFLMLWCTNSNRSDIFKLVMKIRIQWYIICHISVT